MKSDEIIEIRYIVMNEDGLCLLSLRNGIGNWSDSWLEASKFKDPASAAIYVRREAGSRKEEVERWMICPVGLASDVCRSVSGDVTP